MVKIKFTKQIPKIDITEIEKTYKYDDDIFTEEDEELSKLKHIVFDRLNEVDKRIILLYADIGNMRDLGKVLGVSPATVCIKINEIRQKIKDYL